jgi:hypothetical protein
MVIAVAAGFSVLALAESWSGNLLDATCYDKQKTVESCDATSATTQFAFNVAGTVYKLDTAGNTKAATALKNRADQSDPAKPKSSVIMAKVEGTQSSCTIAVQSLDVQ